MLQIPERAAASHRWDLRSYRQAAVNSWTTPESRHPTDRFRQSSPRKYDQSML